MSNYTLTKRGRILLIEIPVVLAIITFTCTNIIDAAVTWIFG